MSDPFWNRSRQNDSGVPGSRIYEYDRYEIGNSRSSADNRSEMDGSAMAERDRLFHKVCNLCALFCVIIDEPQCLG
jgi:hypothetical protein